MSKKGSKLKKTLDESLEAVMVPEDKQSYEAPDNWVWVKLGKVLKAMETRDPTKLNSDTFTYIDIESIDNRNQKIESPKELFIWEAPSRAKRAVNEGDVLISLVRPYLKNIAMVETCHNEAVASTGFYVCRTLDLLDSTFLYYFLRTDVMTSYLISKTKGDNSPSVRSEDFLSGSIPLPPLHEQKRIVERVESLLEKINEAKQLINDIPRKVDQLRKSIVMRLCSGDLTVNWRNMNLDRRTARELLDEINMNVDVQTKSKKRIRSINDEIDVTSLPEIPETWTWERLINISDIQGGVTKGKKYGEKTKVSAPYLRVANVQDGFLDLTEIREIEVLPEEREKYLLKEGDILFTEGGDRDKLGRGTVWKNEIVNCIHQNHIFRARCFEGISPEYISIATKTEFSKTYFFKNARQTVNLASINLTTLGQIPIPIPPSEEQQEIVNIYSNLTRYLDEIEQQYLSTKKKLELITQSILSKAFRGELGTNNPEEESAIEIFKESLAQQLN
ncbi:type I restriction enzyme, S subunit [Brevibacillus sp. IT-7CA2]|uniref:restriction endonuclease subunit S n=1 Tax=Brevibacillus sp. IT-7CA2 TaxID=3026436 RepID=UPI0039DFD7B3